MGDRSLRRRRFLTGVGALSTIAITGCIGADSSDISNDTETTDDDLESGQEYDNSNSESDDKSEDDEDSPDPPDHGSIVFVYDDGPIEDYTQAFPVHQEFDAPATTGIISDRVGCSSDWMDISHLTELAATGWEIASHTTEHTAIGTFEVIEDAEPDDRRVYLTGFRHGHHLGKDIELTDGEQTVHRTVIDYGGNTTGPYLEFATPLDESFAAGETVVRYPAEQMHKSLGDSKRDLEALGFEVDTLLAPYDNFDEYSMAFVPEYYEGVANARHGSRINDPKQFNPYQTRRDYFIEFTTAESVQSDLDAIAERGALGVVGAHTYKSEVNEDGIRTMLEWVIERDITILTLREAIAIYATE